MKFFWMVFFPLAVSGQPFWEKDARSRAAREVLITIPAHLDAWVLRHNRPLQFYGFSAHTRRIPMEVSDSHRIERTAKQLPLEGKGFYNVLFIPRGEELDRERSRFLLPAIQLDGVPFTVILMEKGEKATWIEAESRGPSGKTGTFIRFPVEQIFLYFKPPD